MLRSLTCLWRSCDWIPSAVSPFSHDQWLRAEGRGHGWGDDGESWTLRTSRLWRATRRGVVGLCLLVANLALAQEIWSVYSYDEAGNLMSAQRTDVRSDATHCGAAFAVCSASLANAHGVCVNGACDEECNAGYLLASNRVCGSITSPGVTLLIIPFDDYLIPLPKIPAASYYCGGGFVQPTTDTNNCGACGVVCTTAILNASATCSAGTCVSNCNPGYSSCDGRCAALASDPNNCGACGKFCPGTNGTRWCEAGKCGLTCKAGYTQCGTTCVDLSMNQKNCGACGNSCGTRMCDNGVCEEATTPCIQSGLARDNLLSKCLP